MFLPESLQEFHLAIVGSPAQGLEIAELDATRSCLSALANDSLGEDAGGLNVARIVKENHGLKRRV